MQSSLLWSRALSCLGEGAALQGTARKASVIECTLPLRRPRYGPVRLPPGRVASRPRAPATCVTAFPTARQAVGACASRQSQASAP